MFPFRYRYLLILMSSCLSAPLGYGIDGPDDPTLEEQSPSVESFTGVLIPLCQVSLLVVVPLAACFLYKRRKAKILAMKRKHLWMRIGGGVAVVATSALGIKYYSSGRGPVNQDASKLIRPEPVGAEPNDNESGKGLAAGNWSW